MADEHAIKAQKVRDEIWGLPPDMTANVIAAALREAVAAERKRCADVAREAEIVNGAETVAGGFPDMIREQIAAAIEETGPGNPGPAVAS